MQQVLITGANGALGQALIARMHRLGRYHVIASSRRAAIPGGMELDVCNAAQVKQVIESTSVDLIIHLAATFENDFDQAYAVNVGGARQLLDAVYQAQSRTRVVLVGSAAEYGVVDPRDNPIRTDHVLRPVSPYGLTKAWQTQLGGMYACRSVDVVIARIFNLDGANLSERLFVGRMQRQIDEILAGTRTVIECGSLNATRDYISMADAVEQILAIAAHAQTGDIHHVASGIPITMRDLLARRLAAHGLDMSIVREAPELSNRSGYDVPIIYADITSTTELMKTWREFGQA